MTRPLMPSREDIDRDTDAAFASYVDRLIKRELDDEDEREAMENERKLQQVNDERE